MTQRIDRVDGFEHGGFALSDRIKLRLLNEFDGDMGIRFEIDGSMAQIGLGNHHKGPMNITQTAIP